MRAFILSFMLLNLLFCDVVDVAYKSIKVSANVLNTTLLDGDLYIATDDSIVEIYNIKDEKFKEPILLKRVKNFFSESEGAKVFSVDKIDNTLLVLAEDDYGGRILYVKEDRGLKPIKIANQGIKKALFLDKNRVVLGSISNEIYILNLKTKKIEYDFKISTASLSDMQFNEARTSLAIGAESGKIYIYDMQNKKQTLVLDMHKDNIYDISYKGSNIISGATDRAVGIYTQGKSKKIDTGFLVYGVGLSDDGSIGAYMSDELSDVSIIDMKTLENIALLKTGQSTINSIVFIGKNEVVTSAYERNLLFWRFR